MELPVPATTAYLAARGPTPGLVTARHLQTDAHPTQVIEQLRSAWAAHPDPGIVSSTLLAHDWYRLGHLPAATWPGWWLPVPGIGIALIPDEPPCVIPLAHASALDVDWIYLIDPDHSTVTIHTDCGEPAGVHHLLPGRGRRP